MENTVCQLVWIQEQLFLRKKVAIRFTISLWKTMSITEITVFTQMESLLNPAASVSWKNLPTWNRFKKNGKKKKGKRKNMKQSRRRHIMFVKQLYPHNITQTLVCYLQMATHTTDRTSNTISKYRKAKKLCTYIFLHFTLTKVNIEKKNKVKKCNILIAPTWVRTRDLTVNSRALCRLSYQSIFLF